MKRAPLITRYVVALAAGVSCFGSIDASASAMRGIPAPAVVTVAASCPDGSGAPCSAGSTIYIPPGTEPFALQHEIGHAFDAYYLDAGERHRFQTLAKTDGGLWSPGTGMTPEGLRSPAEKFADAYAACRLGLTPSENWTESYGYMPTRKQHRAVCSFIKRAALDRP